MFHLIAAIAAALTFQPMAADVEKIFRENPEGMAPAFLTPADPHLVLKQWQERPLYGAPPARHPARLATAAERLGRTEDAIARWRAIAVDPASSPALVAEALHAEARLNITRDPLAAQAALDRLAPDQSNAIAAQLLKARVAMMQGRWAEAEALHNAVAGPAQRAGPLPVALVAADMAITAHHRGADKEVADLLVLAKAPDWWLLRGTLLQCDPQEDLRPEDRVVAELEVNAIGEILAATPIWASRPGPMAGKLAARMQDTPAPISPGPPVPRRLLQHVRVELSCASADVRAAEQNPLVHFYRLAKDGAVQTPDFRSIAGIADFGTLLAAGATPEFVAITFKLAVGDSDAPACGQLDHLVAALPANPSLVTLFAMAGGAQNCDIPSQRTALLRQIVEREDFPMADRRVAAGRLVEKNDVPDRAKWASFARLAPDHCWRADEVQQKGLAMEFSDYPQMERMRYLTGLQTIMLKRDATGRLSGFQPLFTTPALLFRTAPTDALAKQQMLPAMLDGKPFACQDIANMNWQLER